MRRAALCLLALMLTGTSLSSSVAQSQPPHAWLFGTWTGGIFPAPAGLSPQQCLAQPVVIFTRELVMRVTLTDPEMTQRVIESVRATPTGADFRFAGGAQVGGMLGTAAPIAGFGCENSNVLHVVRRGENEISFPGCADFPAPLVRCHTR